MRKSLIIGTISLIVAALAFSGCSGKKEQNEQSSDTPAAGMPKAPKFHGSVAGITWAFPNTWTVAPDKPMRSATYIVQPAEGDTDSAECVVYYFGPSSGGGKDANLQRWAGQFEQPDGSSSMDKAKMGEEKINDLNVSTIDLSGTYLVASGPMMQVSGKKEGYRLLGAIVEGPQGSIFFKMTGPDKTMAASEGDFNELIASLEQQTM